jgi:hypothetical protein
MAKEIKVTRYCPKCKHTTKQMLVVKTGSATCLRCVEYGRAARARMGLVGGMGSLLRDRS